jgi:hypothetical protein
MPDNTDPKFFDKRVAQRYQRKGLLDEKEWEKHLKSLPDLAGQAMPVESDLDEDLDDEDDDLEPEAAPQAAAPAPTGEAPQGS